MALIVAPPVDRSPTAADKGKVIASLVGRNDLDLPTADRSTRARVSPAVHYTPGTKIEANQSICEVIRPGRGVGWIYVAMTFDGGPLLASVHVSQVGPTMIDDGKGP